MTSTLAPVATPDFVAAMGQHVASVCVITTLCDGERYGLTATAVSSVCAAPPRLLVCVNKSGLSHAKIASAGVFGVNVLSETQEHVARRFAGMAGTGADRFACGDWDTLTTGSPVLRDAVAVFDCRVAESLEQFSHTVFIGEVVGVRSGQGNDALLYGARRFRNLRKAVIAPETGALESLHF